MVKKAWKNPWTLMKLGCHFQQSFEPFATKLLFRALAQGLQFSINTHSFRYNGKFGLLIDLVVNTGGKNIIENDNTKGSLLYTYYPAASYITL